MIVTLYVVTWNRAKYLERCLDSVLRAGLPTDVDCELLVVNNACTDHTDEVLAHFTDRLPLRRVFEPRPGVSYARTTAVRESRGELLVGLDDDGLVGQGWLQAYLDAYRARPMMWGFGGPVTPVFEGSPKQLAHDIAAVFPEVYSGLDYGEEPGPLDSRRRNIFFGNSAIRRDILERYPFDTRLGRMTGALVGGEDTDLLRQMQADGGPFWWVPQARIDHIIPPARQSLAFFKRYFEGRGKQAALTYGDDGGATIFGYPRWMIRELVQSEVLAGALRASGASPHRWLVHLQRARFAHGYLTTIGKRRIGRSTLERSSRQ
jgi:glycosyltransferase involved in cell wall biosynthesis